MSVWVRPEIAASLQEAGNDPVFEAHSGYLEVLLGVGVLGAVLLALVLWAACARVGAAMWQTPGVLSAFSVGLVAYALLANISETYIGPNLLPWTLLCVATGQAVALRRRAGSRGRSVVPATEPMPADVVVGDPDGEVAGPLDDTPARIGRHEAELLAQPFDDVLDFSFDRPSDDEPIGRAAEFFDDGRVEDRAGSGDAGGEYGVVP